MTPTRLRGPVAVVAIALSLSLGTTRVLAVCADPNILMPTAPGFTIEPYADVTDPLDLSFDADGNLFTGRQRDEGPADEPLKIHRIGPGGSPVVEYGDVPIPDPDTLIVDPSGQFAGVPGAVLVGGGVLIDGLFQGHVFAVLPDESVVTLFGPTATFQNPNKMTFDRAGRLLFTDFNDGIQGAVPPQVLVSTGGDPVQLFSHPTNPLGLAADAAGRVYISTVAGEETIRVYEADGTLVTADFAGNVGANARILFGPGGVWGEDLILLSLSTRELLRIDAAGGRTVLGSDFTGFGGMAFGPDGALYLARRQEDCVWRMAPEGAPPPGPTGQPMTGKKLLLREHPTKASKRALMVVGRDAVVSLGAGNGSDDDPVRTGATLRVAATGGDGFDATYLLPRDGWRYVRKAGANRGYRFARGDPIKRVLIKPGKLIKIVGKGAALDHALATSPDAVHVVLRFGGQKLCMQFTEVRKFKAGRMLLMKNAAAPAACPLP